MYCRLPALRAGKQHHVSADAGRYWRGLLRPRERQRAAPKHDNRQVWQVLKARRTGGMAWSSCIQMLVKSRTQE